MRAHLVAEVRHVGHHGELIRVLDEVGWIDELWNAERLLQRRGGGQREQSDDMTMTTTTSEIMDTRQLVSNGVASASSHSLQSKHASRAIQCRHHQLSWVLQQ